ncbi:acetyltransferase [Enterococcus saigonensis]|uniref:Acetyltransferase n=1 Tax=Enterococcus saigonensis TaxID=1805431 RepID=A0A679INS8_9ENTE|nr:DapH/DapD/GlmU-related protein [Enterococcus saigonensis]BCA86946.1 acetyltransferase [Enterococcus saigonensis]
MRNDLLTSIQNKKIFQNSDIFEKIHEIKSKNEETLFQLNATYHSNSEILKYLEMTTAQKIDPTVSISLPFFSDFGRHIKFGKNIFINQNVSFVDLGGITVEDQVLIGPMSRLITVNHLIDPVERRGLFVSPIKIKKNAWIGANVTILPGVTIGENSIVAADSTVTKDVADNVIVAGSPATIKKVIGEEKYA